jgi:putative ABC transport system substrate-binding protein
MKRGRIMTLLGGAAVTWPLAARAHQRSHRSIGYLSGGVQRDFDRTSGDFRQGLREVGFSEGQNVSIEYRFAENQVQRVPELAADLIRRQVAVIVVTGSQATLNAVKTATTTVPIVFLSGPDPLRTGLVASLNRPGGNLTGVTRLSSDLTAKRLGLLHDTVPQIATFAMLLSRPPIQIDPEFQLMMAQAAARNIGLRTFGVLRIFGVEAGNQSEFEAAFARAAAGGAGAMLVSTSAFFVENRAHLVELAARHKFPTVYQDRDYPLAGGLMSYGASLPDTFRQVGRYAGRILSGEKPGDLPILPPTTFEFVINLKTAKALGLTIPPGVRAIANEIIE